MPDFVVRYLNAIQLSSIEPACSGHANQLALLRRALAQSQAREHEKYRQARDRGASILGEVRNVEIPGLTKQLLCSKYHDFLAIFALAYSKINQIA